MHVKLVVVEGDVKTPEIRLKIPAIVGRGRGASLQIPQALVSRQHCELVAIDGKLRVRDLGSLNGTIVNGKKVSEAEIASGQTLTIGAVTFRVEYGDSVQFADTPKLPAVQESSSPPIARPEADHGPKTDELLVDFGAEIAASPGGSAMAGEPGAVDFLAPESEGDASTQCTQQPSLLPPLATPLSPAAGPPVAPLAIPTAPLAIPVAVPVAAPVASPLPPAPPAVAVGPTPAGAPESKPADDDDDDLRAFLQSLGK